MLSRGLTEGPRGTPPHLRGTSASECSEALLQGLVLPEKALADGLHLSQETTDGHRHRGRKWARWSKEVAATAAAQGVGA